MKPLFIALFFTVSAHASPKCDGIVATPAQREAYTQTMIRSWPKDQQTAFVRNHENHIKDMEQRARWDRLYDEERMAILQYTSALFGDLNRSLRSENFTMWTEFTTLCSALNKLPDYQGWVFRRVDISEDQIKQIQSKKTYTDPAFMSTAKADVLIWEKNTMLKIFTTHGKDLMGLGSHSEEKEVLLLPGSRFKVLRFKENPAGTKFKYEITLKEVNSLDI